MLLTGQLSEFTLPEIFQFIEQSEQSGLLSLQIGAENSQQPGKVYYLWFQKGRIVALADQLNNKYLLSMIQQRGWLNPQVLNLVNELSKTEQALGLYLQTQGALTAEQLQILFHAQVLQPVCGLFKVQDAQFKFDSKATLPQPEMTGLSLLAAEVSLLGLRVLRDWSVFSQKLPHPSLSLTKAIAGKPQLQLDSQEWQVWELANGSSLEAIALQLQLPVTTVQQIVFRMAAIGLVKAVALEPKKQAVAEITPELAAVASNGTATNQSFMKNLVELLNTKIV